MVGAGFFNTSGVGDSVRAPVALLTAGLGAAWVGAYLFIIGRQGTELDAPGTVFIAAFVSVMAALALGAAAVRGRNAQRAQTMLYAAAGGFLPAGILGLASVGLLLILVGFLALVAAGPRIVPSRLGVAAGGLSAFAFAIGVALTIRVS